MTFESLVAAGPTILATVVIIATALGHILPESRFQRACLAIGINGGRLYAEVHGKSDPTASTQTKAGTSSTDPASDALLASAAQLTAARKDLSEAITQASLPLNITPINAAANDSIPTAPASPSAKQRIE